MAVFLAAAMLARQAVVRRLSAAPGLPSGANAPRDPAASGPPVDMDPGVAIHAAAVAGDALPAVAAADDRFVRAETLKETVHPPDPQGHYRRERLIPNTGKHKRLRVEEHWQKAASATGEDQLLHWRVMVADHVLVQLRDGFTQDDLERVLKRHHLTLRAALRMPRGFLVAVDEAEPGTVPAMIQVLTAESVVDVAEPDYVYTLNETRPDDAFFPSLWGMEQIGMPLVWDAATGTGAVVVAVFDTGLDLTHPDLAANLWVNPAETANGQDDDGNGFADDIHGWDFYDNNNDPSDVNGHGSHVAGTIGAVGNNGLGVAGVNWKVRLMPVKFFGTNSFGQLEGYAQDAIEGMYYVIGQSLRGVPVRVTNHSWGGSGYSDLMREAFRIAQQNGILHVAAAGNDGNLNNDTHPYYPASFDLSNMVAVANTRSDDSLHPGSHYGALSVDLGAPGSGILSTVMGGGYGNKTGSSMASPHVAGVAALLFDSFMDLTSQEVRQLILAGVDPTPSLSGKTVTGGRLNAAGSVGQIPLRIAYEPVQHTAEAYAEIPVSAVIRPGLSFAQEAVVLWNTTGDTAVFETNVLHYAGADRFGTLLPGQPKGTAVYYMIRAQSRAGQVSVHPGDAPATLHRVDITHNVSLWISGHPQQIATVSPAYGTDSVAWGRVIEAAAPAYTAPQQGFRWRCDGWNGAGSVPFFGTTNRVAFEIRESSFLVWCWKSQALLAQISDPPGILSAETWTDADLPASTVTAPAKVMLDGIEYAFVGWAVDGDRFPDEIRPALNPAYPLPPGGPRTAVARYRVAAQDLDGDGLPDWWEELYFNHLDYSGDDDPDGDGFSNAEEFADRSNPADAGSRPEGPEIAHVPLSNLAEVPAPWRVTAVVTDRVAVATVVLRWQRNGGLWHEVRMDSQGGAGDRYEAFIPAPSSPGDAFSYQLVAEDIGANASTTTVFTFTVQHPLRVGDPVPAAFSVPAGRTAVLRVQIANPGNARLEWETVEGWLETVAAAPGNWTHDGPASQWHISTRESYSAPYAWFCGNPVGGLYNNSMDASLYTPMVTLGAAPRLRFMHWAEMEYDGRPGYANYYWDGAVVEIRREGQSAFGNMDPVGGYPYRITPNPDSPFVAHRPCLGGQTGGWQAVEFDLAAYAGETVQVRFRFGTDGYVTARGWFVDDIAFSWGVPWLSAPAAGTVSAGESVSVALKLDASSLEPGTYQTYWTLRSNAPGAESFAWPVTLQVTTPPPAASMQLNADAPGGFVITWPSRTGVVYHVYTATVLGHDADWIAVPGLTHLPGVAGFMSYTGALDAVPAKFFRIDEESP